jgi:hypothetical protein
VTEPGGSEPDGSRDGSPEDAQLRAESAQIDQLLTELRELVPLPAWSRIEQVIRRIVALYAGGLSRALAHALDAGALPDELDDLVSADDLLASLLALHGLHPRSPEERIRRALAEVAVTLGLPADGLVLAELREGVVVQCSTGSLGGGAMSERVAEGVIRRAIEAAAPEIASIQITGHAAARAPDLVQIRPRREAP